MSVKQESLMVPAYIAREMQRIMDEPDSSVKKDSPEFDEGVRFDDKRFMVIQVIGSTQPAIEPAWSQGVLFDDNGNELACTEVCETFLGDYQIEFEATDYIVSVERKATQCLVRTSCVEKRGTNAFSICPVSS